MFNTYIYIYIHIRAIHTCQRVVSLKSELARATNPDTNRHTRHILLPSEIDSGPFWADFTDSEGKHLFHGIG